MTVLPSYSPGETIGDGGSTLRLLHKDAEAGVGLKHFGDQLGGAAVMTAKADAAMAAIEDAEQKKVAGLGDALIRADMQTTWAQKQADLQANIDPTGKDYTKTVAAAFDEHMSGYEGKFSGRLAGENQVLDAKFRSHVIQHAIGYEATTRYNTQLAVAKQLTSDAAAVTSANPDAFHTVIAEGKLQADILGFTGKVREPFMRDLTRSAEAGAVSGTVAKNPGAVLEAARGALAGFSKTDTPPEQAKVINAAKATDMDPALMLGIGHIETGGKFNTDAVSPTGKKGVFQTSANSAAYGAHDPTDTTAAGVATGTFLAARQQDMRDKGVDPTPGRTMMMHNVGEGVAWRLIREQDPNKSMGQLLYDVYGDSKNRNGDLLRDVVGKHNPTFYNPSMTVAEVRANYETKVRAAMTATSQYLNEGGTTDDIARAALSKLTGLPIKELGAADLAKAADVATQSLTKMTKADAKLQLGTDIFNGDVRMQPFNDEHKKAVDAIVKEHFPGIANDLVRQGGQADPGGDEVRQAAFSQAAAFARKNSYLPHQWRDAMRELVMTGDAKSPAKVEAYNALVEMRKHNPTAYEATGVDADVTKRLDIYERKVERTGNAAQALEFISQEFSPEHKETRAALKDVVDGTKGHPGEVSKLKLTDITDMLKRDNGLWRAPIEPTNSSQDELMVHAYKETYRDYRYTQSPEAAKELALSDVKRSWGLSVAFVSPTGAARFMQNPPDNFYKQPIVGMKPFEDQAREVVGQELARRYPRNTEELQRIQASDKLLGRHHMPTSSYDPAAVEIQIQPAGSLTNDEARAGNSAPHYQVSYRDPNTGAVTIADSKWQPNLERMRAESDAARKAERDAIVQREAVVREGREHIR